MNVSDLLNPSVNSNTIKQQQQNPYLQSIPYATRHDKETSYKQKQEKSPYTHHHHPIGKPRSRFSVMEDNIILEGVAQKLTWGQISERLPNRKRATCFNRYRTLQGIRKSRHFTSTTTTTTTAATADNSDTSSLCSTVSPVSPAEPSFCFNEPTKSLSPPLSVAMYQSKDVHYNSKLNESHLTYELIHHPHLPPIYSYSPYSL